MKVTCDIPEDMEDKIVAESLKHSFNIVKKLTANDDKELMKALSLVHHYYTRKHLK